MSVFSVSLFPRACRGHERERKFLCHTSINGMPERGSRSCIHRFMREPFHSPRVYMYGSGLICAIASAHGARVHQPHHVFSFSRGSQSRRRKGSKRTFLPSVCDRSGLSRIGEKVRFGDSPSEMDTNPLPPIRKDLRLEKTCANLWDAP